MSSAAPEPPHSSARQAGRSSAQQSTQPRLTLVRPLRAHAPAKGRPGAHVPPDPPTAAGALAVGQGSSASPGAEAHTLADDDRLLLEQMVPALGTALVEVLVGRRPAHSVERWVDPSLYERIRDHVTVRASLARGGPALDTRATASAHRLSPVSASVVEASVVVRTRRRARALAMRFERTRARWRLTEFLSL